SAAERPALGLGAGIARAGAELGAASALRLSALRGVCPSAPATAAAPIAPGASAALVVGGASAALVVGGASAALVVGGAPAALVVGGAPAALLTARLALGRVGPC